MINLIRKHFTLALIYTGINTVVRTAYGTIIVVLMPFYLSPEMQGYWFTMLGLAALMVFADLGFSTIITQFAAHEFAYLRLDENWKITGERKRLERLSSFFAFSVKWMLLMAASVTPVIFFIGIYMFSQKGDTGVSWLSPWTIYLIGTALNFINNSLLCFIEGCNLVGLAQKLKLYSSLIMIVTMTIALVMGLGLHALSISMIISSLIGSLMNYRVLHKMIQQLVSVSKEHTYSWLKEFFPLFWRFAVSWTSGYFIFQFITPLVFHYQGAVAAGKIGISMALWTAIHNLSHVWIYAVRPNINFYVSRREWDQLDRLFKRRLWLSVATYIAGALTVFAVLFFLRGRFEIVNRFADIITMLFLAASWFVSIISSAIAVYLRAHKEEPLVGLTVASSVFIVVATLLCAKYLSPEFLLLGFFSSSVFGLPWLLHIYTQKRKEWHYGCAE